MFAHSIPTNRSVLRTLTIGALLSLLPLTGVADIIYVDDDADPNGDGTSWPTAFKFLQDALHAADPNDPNGVEIRVAGGIYKPDQDEAGNVTPGDRAATFQLISGVGLYGGYAGLSDPNNPDNRDMGLYESRLSGDLNGDDDPNAPPDPNDPARSENSYHVVTGNGTDQTAVLDGLTITAGNANGGDSHDDGGGMYNNASSPRVASCTFSGNSAYHDGGGVCCWGASSPTLTDCTISGNAAYAGGGVWCWGDSSPILINCTISSNLADSAGGGVDCSDGLLINCTISGNSVVGPYPGFGGGISCYDGLLTNCTISGNLASWDGGGVACGDALLTNCIITRNSAGGLGGGVACADALLTNCTINGNSACHGGGVACMHSSPTLTNCILWGDTPNEIYVFYPAGPPNPTVTYCDIDGGWPGAGNINADPQFVDPNNADYHLSADSPCIDAADNTAVPPDTADLDGDGDTTEPISMDLDGRLRFADRIGTPDTGNPDPNDPDRPTVDMGAYEYQCTGDLDGDGVIGLSDLSQLLANYPTASGAIYADGDLDQDGDVDLADLAALLANYRQQCP